MSRERMLANIAKALDHNQNTLTKRQVEMRARLSTHPRGPEILPVKQARLNPIPHFRQKAEAVQATTVLCQDVSEIPEAVAHYMLAQNLGDRLRISPHPAIGKLGLDWQKAANLIPFDGNPSIEDKVVLSYALAGICETGSIVVNSDYQTPILDHFLAECEIIILKTSTLFIAMEDFWQNYRDHANSIDTNNPSQGLKNNNGFARAISLVTGPSRTGDVGQKIELGAHGPLKLHIILIQDHSF